MCITISEESAQAIKRLPEMKSWSVQPTMAPGRGKKADGLMPGKQNKGKKSKTDAAKTKIRRGKYAKKAKHSKLGKKGKKKKAKGKNQEATTEVDAQLVAEEAREQADKKKKKKKPVAVSLSVQPPSSKEYRRTQTGFSVIRGQVQELLDLDQAAFPDAPAFSHEGLCRLKIDAAKERTRQQIIEESSEAIDALKLGHACAVRVYYKMFCLIGFSCILYKIKGPEVNMICLWSCRPILHSITIY